MKDYAYTIGLSCVIIGAAAFASFNAFKNGDASKNQTAVETQQVSYVSNLAESSNAELPPMLYASLPGQEPAKKGMAKMAVEKGKKAVEKNMATKAAEKSKPGVNSKKVQKKSAKPKQESIISIIEMTDKEAIKTKPKELDPEFNRGPVFDPDLNDPGRISIVETRPFPVDSKPLEPMDLLTAKPNELHVLMGAKDGPSPMELKGTWEILPCHSDSGPIGKRSFDVSGLLTGTGAYFETVQLYSDKANKKLSKNYETTLFVKIDAEHILAAKHPGTAYAVYSVLKKVGDESLPMGDNPKALIKRARGEKATGRMADKTEKKKTEKKKTDKMKSDSSDSKSKMKQSDSKKMESKKMKSKRMESKKNASKKPDSNKLDSKKMESKKPEMKKPEMEKTFSKSSETAKSAGKDSANKKREAKKKPAIEKKPDSRKPTAKPKRKGNSIITRSRPDSQTQNRTFPWDRQG